MGMIIPLSHRAAGGQHLREQRQITKGMGSLSGAGCVLSFTVCQELGQAFTAVSYLILTKQHDKNAFSITVSLMGKEALTEVESFELVMGELGT